MTYEKSKRSWSSGFLGYRDNSPEAKQRRREHQAEHMATTLLKKWKPALAYGELQLLIAGRVEYHLKGRNITVNGKSFKLK